MPRIAPTERTSEDGPPLRGVVHDDTARYMGGVAGHAGLFSTADDLGALRPDDAQSAANSTASASSARSRSRSSPTPADAARSAHPARARLGHRFALLQQSRRAVPASARTATRASPARRSGSIRSTNTYVILLTNSVHPVPRPAITPLRGEGRHHRGRRARHCGAGRHSHRLQRDPDRRRRPPRSGAQRRHARPAWTFWPRRISRRSPASASA